MDFSVAALAASFTVSTIGFGIFLYGKRETRGPQLLVGLAMMVFPYFVAAPLLVWGIGAGLVACLVGAVRAGL